MKISNDRKGLQISPADVLKARNLEIEIDPELPMRFNVSRSDDGTVRILLEAV